MSLPTGIWEPDRRFIINDRWSFKSTATKHINLLRDTPGTPVWQRNYYEHIIRDEESLQVIRQ